MTHRHKSVTRGSSKNDARVVAACLTTALAPSAKDCVFSSLAVPGPLLPAFGLLIVVACDYGSLAFILILLFVATSSLLLLVAVCTLLLIVLVLRLLLLL